MVDFSLMLKENTVRVIIAGGRTFSNYQLLKLKCDKILSLLPKSSIEIIEGEAKGADTLAKQYAKEKGIRCKGYPADWDAYGKRAGYLRNEEMADYASEFDNGYLIAFWDGKSPGTKMMIDLAKQHGLTVRVIKYA